MPEKRVKNFSRPTIEQMGREELQQKINEIGF
jgi:hypothetical protein